MSTDKVIRFGGSTKLGADGKLVTTAYLRKDRPANKKERRKQRKGLSYRTKSGEMK